MSELNKTIPRGGVRSYLKSHNPEGVHVAGLGEVWAASHSRPYIWPAAARKSLGARPTLCRPSCGVGKNLRIAKAGDAGSPVPINQDVRLKYDAHVSYVSCLCGMDGWRTV